VVGNYIDNAGNVNGFVDDNGIVTTVDVPGASQTDILGITDSGDIYGYYNDGSGQHGFVGTTNGNSVFSASGGQNIINGVGSHDTIVFDGPRAEYTLTVKSDGSLLVVDNGSSGDGTSQVLNVEHLQFTDQTVFAETPDNANIARLYSAAFNRLPDTAGLNFWEDVYANSISAAVKSQGYYVSLAETNDGSGISIAANFIASPEFQADYGTLSDVSFVTAMYENVLGRTPDQAGLNFWVGQLEGGAQTRAVVLVGFAESPENVAKTAPWLITT
jgi:serralysin